MKSPRTSGALFVDVSRDTFVARLAALVPPPFQNLVRYYGVFANRHSARPGVLAGLKDNLPPVVRQLSLFKPGPAGGQAVVCTDKDAAANPPTSIGWAKLLARVFEVDVTICRSCGGKMRVLEAVTTPDKIVRYLHGARAPPRPSLPGQLDLFDSSAVA